MIESVNNVASLDMMESRSRPAQTSSVDDGFGFDDFLDIINPLQHVPLVGTAYRAITGDHIETPAKLAGGALFGGLFGFLGALGSTAYEEIIGESVDETMLSVFGGSNKLKLADATRATAAYSSAQLLID